MKIPAIAFIAKRGLQAFFLVIGSLFVGAQERNPAHWTFSSLRLGGGLYEIHLTAVIDPGWHIYSLVSPESAGFPTSIRFKRSPLVRTEGKMLEIGTVLSKYERAFETTVKYFENKVEFVQRVKVKGKVKATISGTVDFMTCNDQTCMPEEIIPFNIVLE